MSGEPAPHPFTVATAVITTVFVVVFILVAGYGSLHYVESSAFCGQACHALNPQFTAWQSAPHAKVTCAQCHVGDGAFAFVRAKVSGLRELAHYVSGSFPRPIPPGAPMPPSAQAQGCGNCHRPEHSVGERVRIIREYADDESNSETTTVLQMHLGRSPAGRSIHWHADPAIRVEYVSAGEDRQTIPYVKVIDAGGRAKEYRTADATDPMIRDGHRRTIDCADCHNAIGHPISPTPEKAVDAAIASGAVNRQLPYARREGVRLVKAAYSTADDAAQAIDQGLRRFYESSGSVIDAKALRATVAGLQDVYRRNVFPRMKVTWGTYPDNKGHVTSSGCFRCHDDLHKASDGSTISADCEYCHKQVEWP